MNTIDIIVLLIIATTSIIAAYKGFVGSLLDIAAFFFSWLASLFFSPALSRYIRDNHGDIVQTLITFSEGALRIESVEERTIPVSVFTQDRLTRFVSDARFPYPFDRLLLSNLQELALENLNTLGEYFNHSIAYILLNIITFLAVYFAARLFFSLLSSVARGVFGLPVLKQIDWVLGLLLGALRGFVIVNLLFLILSVMIVIVPVEIVRSYVGNSVFADFFTRFNIFTMFLRGII